MKERRLSSKDIVELAFDASSCEELWQELVRRLVASTGCCGGVMANPDDPVTPHSVYGFSVEDVEAVRRPFWFDPPEVSGVGPLLEALATHRAIIDTRVYASSEYERLPAPRLLGIRSSIAAMFAVGSGPLTFLCLARRRGNGFDLDTETYVRSLVPALAVATASRPIPRAQTEAETISLPSSLTDRQREICLYVLHGYTNGEIAQACGISLHTVRNHLVRLFRTFDVGTRTELASRLLYRAGGVGASGCNRWE